MSEMTDAERRSAAAAFFWKMLGDQIVTPQEAERHINTLAKAIPPFTALKVREPAK